MITIKDVARKVGVTPTTVSMVMRGDERISPPTREKVLKAAKELNYYPNHIGRSLVKGKTNTVAVAASLYYGPFKSDLYNGIDYALASTKYNIMQFPSRPGQDDEALREIYYGRRGDGTIAVTLRPGEEILNEYRNSGKPIIMVEDTAEGLPGVKVDNFKGAYEAVSNMISKGRKKIALIYGINREYASARERTGGYEKALRDNGIDPEKMAKFVSERYIFLDGIEMFDKVYERRNDFDAIFVPAGDMVAMGIMKGAREKGMKIPQDFMITGYDGLDSGSLISPALTTVKQPVFDMGMEAFKYLDRLMNGGKDEGIKVFDPKLVIRESA